MTPKEFEDFINFIPRSTSYLDSGFDIYQDRNIFASSFQSAADFNSLIESVSFDNVSGGSTTSSGKKIKIDYDKGQILISDGGLPQILIGELT